MNQSNESRQGRRRRQPAPDVLEDRMVLSAGQGSTFAIMPGSVAGPGMVSSLQFKLDPNFFTSPQRDGRIVLGIDVTPAVSNSTGASTTSTSKAGPPGHRVTRNCSTKPASSSSPPTWASRSPRPRTSNTTATCSGPA